jgi:Ni/Fe-hydrogenase subunit HybB-like protein/Fe-S-cluster-containing dehydrogenase component
MLQHTQMQPGRRRFLKAVGCLTAGAAGTGIVASTRPLLAAAQAGHASGPADPMGVLVDMTACIGCRLCEYACKKANHIEPGELRSYDDQSVFSQKRRPSPNALTVVNAWDAPAAGGHPVYAKLNCMHCNHAACVSACIVGALSKQDNGAVTYDAWKCIGCRYCMVACPFQLPTYEYGDVLTPEVRKCQFCFHERTSQGDLPACVKECPRQAMTYGKRSELLVLAHERIAEQPGSYVDHIYGEHEVGGTSWMYLSSVPFEQAGFLTLGSSAPPALTEAIQHGVFKYWIAPVGWYALLMSMFWWTGRRAHARQVAESDPPARPAAANRLWRSERHAQTAGVTAPQEQTIYEGGTSGFSVAGGAVGLLDPIEVTFSPGTASSSGEPDGNGRHHVREGNDAAKHGHDAAPVDQKLLTPGVWVLIALVAVGALAWLGRFVAGLEATTNLDQQFPWGLWIAMDVGSGIALAGGGFVAAAIFHVFHREHYHTLARSALVTALLGYTLYVPGLLADIGRWYNIWHPTLPNMWQANSVLFEVGICVMIYLNVQYCELTPIVCERLSGWDWLRRRPRLHMLLDRVHHVMNKLMPALLVLGVALSTFHQSSLGNLMVIAPYKLHHLWWSPLSPLLFLLSAIMVGLPMVIFTILYASWSLNRRPEMHILSRLASRYVPAFIALYLAAKVADMIWRGTYGYLVDGSYEGVLWTIEVLAGVVLPLVLFLRPGVRRSPRWLAATCLLVISGVILNRLNVFVLAYHPPFTEKRYFPSAIEFMVSIGLVAALLLVYRVMVTYLPILSPQPRLVRAA